MRIKAKEKSVELRRNGWSIRRIAKEVGASKSSVSAWVREVVLTKEQQESLLANKETAMSAFKRLNELKSLVARNRWQQYQEQGYSLSKTDDLFRVICALYWGEGTKKQKNRQFRMGNSDPDMIRLVVAWLVRQQAAFSVDISYYEDQDADDVKKYWLTNVSALACARKIILYQYKDRPRKKVVCSMPYGFAYIRANTELFFMMLGGIRYLTQMNEDHPL